MSVLEAPLLKEPNLNSPVLQWVKKGESLFLHPEILQIIDEDQNVTFYKTQDSLGQTVYIHRSHIWVSTDDIRELTQKLAPADPTDYRLLEPLPEDYPFIQRQKFRAQYLFTGSHPSSENYPYNQKIAAKGYSYRYEFGVLLAKRTRKDLLDRWYVGMMFNFRFHHNNFVLSDRKSQEDWFRMGFGPTLMYDVHKTEKFRLNWNSTFLIYPYSQVFIYQHKWSTDETQGRTYRAWNVGARSGLYYQRMRLIGETDFVAGLWGEVETSQKYRYTKGTTEREWWTSGAADSFRLEPQISAGISIGFQSLY